MCLNRKILANVNVLSSWVRGAEVIIHTGVQWAENRSDSQFSSRTSRNSSVWFMWVYVGGLRWDEWSCMATEGWADSETSKRHIQIRKLWKEVKHHFWHVSKGGGSWGGVWGVQQKRENAVNASDWIRCFKTPMAQNKTNLKVTFLRGNFFCEIKLFWETQNSSLGWFFCCTFTHETRRLEDFSFQKGGSNVF